MCFVLVLGRTSTAVLECDAPHLESRIENADLEMADIVIKIVFLLVFFFYFQRNSTIAMNSQALSQNLAEADGSLMASICKKSPVLTDLHLP